MNKLTVALLGCLIAADARAVERWTNGIDGVGRVSILAGWKFTQNDWFFNESNQNGYPTVSKGIGGPQGSLSFGYGATSWIEASIDLFIGHDRFQIAGFDPINVLTYGALLGIRCTFMDLLFKGFAPFFGIGVGPTLGYVFGQPTADNVNFMAGTTPPIERLVTGVGGTAGVTYRVAEHVGISLEYRFLFARGVWYTSGVNTGGHFVSLGLVIYIARTPSIRDGMLNSP